MLNELKISGFIGNLTRYLLSRSQRANHYNKPVFSFVIENNHVYKRDYCIIIYQNGVDVVRDG